MCFSPRRLAFTIHLRSSQQSSRVIPSTRDLRAVMPFELCSESAAIWPLDLLVYSGPMVCTMCLDNYTRVCVSDYTFLSVFCVHYVLSTRASYIAGRASGMPCLHSPYSTSLLHIAVSGTPPLSSDQSTPAVPRRRPTESKRVASS